MENTLKDLERGTASSSSDSIPPATAKTLARGLLKGSLTGPDIDCSERKDATVQRPMEVRKQAGRVSFSGNVNHKKSKRTPVAAGGGTDKAAITCHGCGGSGHIKRECPAKAVRTCYACGEVGHVQMDCSKKKGKRSAFKYTAPKNEPAPDISPPEEDKIEPAPAPVVDRPVPDCPPPAVAPPHDALAHEDPLLHEFWYDDAFQWRPYVLCVVLIALTYMIKSYVAYWIMFMIPGIVLCIVTRICPQRHILSPVRVAPDDPLRRDRRLDAHSLQDIRHRCEAYVWNERLSPSIYFAYKEAVDAITEFVRSVMDSYFPDLRMSLSFWWDVIVMNLDAIHYHLMEMDALPRYYYDGEPLRELRRAMDVGDDDEEELIADHVEPVDWAGKTYNAIAGVYRRGHWSLGFIMWFLRRLWNYKRFCSVLVAMVALVWTLDIPWWVIFHCKVFLCITYTIWRVVARLERSIRKRDIVASNAMARELSAFRNTDPSWTPEDVLAKISFVARTISTVNFNGQTILYGDSIVENSVRLAMYIYLDRRRRTELFRLAL